MPAEHTKNANKHTQISLPIWQAFLIQKFMKDEVIKNENKTVHGNGGNKGNSQILRSRKLR